MIGVIALSAPPMLRDLLRRRFVGRSALLLALGCGVPLFARAAAQTPVVVDSGSISGVATDSVRGGLLAGAFIELLPFGRQVRTDTAGRFRFQHLPPNLKYQLRIMDALLDTLGLALLTPNFALRAGEAVTMNVAIPSTTRLLSMLCPASAFARGPSALVGFVRDPDTGAALDSVTVSLVYDDSPAAFLKQPVNRVAQPNATGHFAICGLPAQVSGNVLLSRKGSTSAEIPVSITGDTPLVRRALDMSRAEAVVSAPGDSATAPMIVRGPARLTGRVTDRNGAPIAGARIQMDRTGAATLSGRTGAFTLDSVPTGTQSLTVRKIGYSLGHHAVDVSRDQRAPVMITMADFVPTLAPVVTSSERSRDLDRVGFTRRKDHGFGFFLEGDQIDRGPPTLGEALRMIPGLRVGYDAGNQKAQKAMIMGARDPKACLRYVVDGVVWQEIGGDIERFVRPEEIEALEMYSATTVPGEFVAAGRGRCSVLVLWTKQRIRRAKAG